jgi:predicted AlkP superfamily phosphohydrolase/phosphomutase
MKILVIGLDSASPEILFTDERLENIRRIMEFGCYGRLESVIPSEAVPAWISMATSQDPGSLGVYGANNRVDHSYDGLKAVDSRSVQEIAIWDYLASAGKRSILIGVPPIYPLRKINGIAIGDAFTIPPELADFAYPAEVKEEVINLVGEYPVDVENSRTTEKELLHEQIFTMSRKQFQLVRHFLETQDWDYFQFVDTGLDLIQRRFWQYFDPEHRDYESDNSYKTIIPDYYHFLDEQIGQILELLSDDTVVLIVSTSGIHRLDGGFCLNEWLVNAGLLALNNYPEKITPFHLLDVNWEKTKVWGEGDGSAQIFLNVRGREPHGVIEPQDCLSLRDNLKANLEATLDDLGEPIGTLVFKPEEIYQKISRLAPDLFVRFGDAWQSISAVGYHNLHVRDESSISDGCCFRRFGAFILAAANNPLSGEIHDAHLLNIAPTLLDLAGYEIPASMQGKSLVTGQSFEPQDASDLSRDEEEILRERLSGLGYIS